MNCEVCGYKLKKFKFEGKKITACPSCGDRKVLPLKKFKK